MIRRADINDVNEITRLGCKLWPNNCFDDLKLEFLDIINDINNVILICIENNKTIAFAQMQLRHDYVEGTETSPVAYLEGIFVEEEYRGKGIGRSLINSLEDYLINHNIKEFASDCELNNIDSYNFHLKMGFIEANRIICFTKKVK